MVTLRSCFSRSLGTTGCCQVRRNRLFLSRSLEQRQTPPQTRSGCVRENSTDRCLSAGDGVVSCAEACAAYRCITFRFAVMQATMMSGISLHFANLATIVFTIRRLSPCEKLPLREANPSHSSFLTEQATGLRLSPQSVSVVPHSFNHIVAPSVKTNTWPENGTVPPGLSALMHCKGDVWGDE